MKTYGSVKSLENIAKITKAMMELGSVTATELSDLTGLSTTTIGGYLHYMEANGIAHCSEPAVKFFKGNASAKWSLGNPPAITCDNTDDMPRKIVEVTYWTPQLNRDPYALPAKFFSPARA